MTWPATISNALWLTSNLPALARFQWALDHPAAAQWQLLRHYLSRHAASSYGQRHGFAAIKNYKEFTTRIPINQYDDLHPWILRIMQGEKHVLNSETVTHLIPTSGSSGARKLIPFTPDLQREWDRAIGPWISNLYIHQPSVLCGPAYWSISPAVQVEDSSQSVVPIGFDDDTSYLGGFKKRLVQEVLAAPSELRLVSDMEQFRYLTLLCLLRQRDLRLISIWHPSFLFLLFKSLSNLWSHLLDDIQNGSCRYSKSIPERLLLSMRLHPMPKRAAELKNLEPQNYQAIWPKLKLISCWGDAHARHGLEEMRKMFPQVVIQPKGLIATEAIVTIPFSNHHPLAIGSHFYEFLDAAGKVRLAHELQLQEIYQIIVTTSGGLWRYALNDLVQVTGFVGKTPSLQFLGRTGNVSDHFGEKLSEPFALQAIQRALSGMRTNPHFILLAPDGEKLDWHYTLFVEGEIEADTGLASRLEAALSENPHYAWCRQLGQLKPLRLFQITSEASETYLNHELAQGKRLGEIKPCSFSSRMGWAKLFKGNYSDLSVSAKKEMSL